MKEEEYKKAKLKVVKTYKQLSPSVCCNSMDQPNFSSIAKMLNPVLKTNIPKDLYEEWNDCFGKESGKNLNVFWCNVYSYKDSADSNPFKELAELVLNILYVPTSNACVERVFSIMNLTKTKIRNKMQYELLEALLRLNTYITNNSICCEKFEPSPEMLKLFNSNAMYNKISEANNSEDFDTEIFDIVNIG